jgi:hypothetical protein
MTLRDKLLKLAENLVDAATSHGDRIPFPDKVDALKTATTCYATLTKVQVPADTSGEANFANFAKELERTNGDPKALGSDRVVRLPDRHAFREDD